MQKSEPSPNENLDEYKLEWEGGFSYLTYLTKRTTVSIKETEIDTEIKNRILGIIRTSPKTSSIPLLQLTKISIGTKINWFQLIFATFFTVFPILTGFGTNSVISIVLAILFFWLTFRNTKITLFNRTGARTEILTNSKGSANSFVENLVSRIDQLTASSNKQPIVVEREGNKPKGIIAIFVFIVAVAAITFSLFIQSGDNTIEWVKDGQLPQSNYTMQEVLENEDYFSNVEWSVVTYNGSTNIDDYVMYESTYSESGVKVLVRTVFQVFGEDHFSPVEFSIDGELYELTKWKYFLVDASDKLQGNPSSTPSTTSVVDTVEPTKEPEVIVESTIEPEMIVKPATTVEVGKQNTGAIQLQNFSKWEPHDPNLTLTQKLDGDQIILTTGLDTPNGIKLQVFSELIEQGWNLPLPTDTFMSSPFDNFDDLLPGFNIFLSYHDFGNDGVPELIVVASDELLETYVWIFTYDYLYSENATSPLRLIWNGEGQSNISIEGNTIELPYGSQGLFEEYQYSEGKFTKIEH